MDEKYASKSYSHPPITEAVIEVRLGADVSNAKLKKATDRLSKKYFTTQTEQQVEAKLEFLQREVAFKEKAPIYKLSSADQTDQCIMGARSLAWVRRSPYDGWLSFQTRFKDEFITVLKAVGDVSMIRIGLRYVNRIDVRPEGDVARYEDYLNFKIDHGDLLEPTAGYQWLVAKEFPETHLKALVQSASVNPELPGLAAFSFDIDIGCDVEVPQKAEGVLAKLEIMRDLKNRIFEAGISDRAREMYL